nr:hypothetical protein [Tanacetum cinerariifolium]
MTPDERLVLKEKVLRLAKGRDDQKDLAPHGRASIDNGIFVQMFPMTSKGIQPNKDDIGRRRKDWVSYGGKSITFHPYAERIKELSCYTLEDDGGGLSRSKRMKRGNILGRNSKSKSQGDNRWTNRGNTKLFEKEGRLTKWATEIRTYDILYILRREAEGSVVKKFFGQGEQVEEMPNAKEGGTLNLSRKLQEKSASTPRAWRLYLVRETIKEGLSVEIILEVLVGIKTIPSVEETSSSKKGKAASNVPCAKPNYN